MKKLLFPVLLLILLWSCNEDPSKKVKKENLEKAKQELAEMNKFPVMKFDVSEINFGNHREGEILDTVFRFTNTGEAPLIISKVKTSCGCTVPEWPKKPVQPGEKGIIKVRFDTHHKRGHQVKTITIHSNEKQLTRVLKIVADIEPDPNAAKTKTNTVKNPKRLPQIISEELKRGR